MHEGGGCRERGKQTPRAALTTQAQTWRRDKETDSYTPTHRLGFDSTVTLTQRGTDSEFDRESEAAATPRGNPRGVMIYDDRLSRAGSARAGGPYPTP